MGSFRLILALSVMMSHYAFYPDALPHPLTGDVAVEAFYIISGFLITLVLVQKYQNSSSTFYTNRAFRIYPIYWIALLIYLTADALVSAGFFRPPTWGLPYYQETSALWWWQQSGSLAPTTLSMALPNLLILGQDVLTFINKGGFFSTTHIELFYQKFFIVKVAWTVSIELMFYIIAPFVVRHFWPVAVVCGVSLASQCLFFLFSSMSPDWYSRIFPFTLTFFMAGSISYRGYVRLISRPQSRARDLYILISIASMIALTIIFPKLPMARAIYLSATAIFLPGVVAAGRRIRLDGLLGDLSYPIYLIHPLFMIVIPSGSARISAEVIAIGGTLFISAALAYLVEWPVDRYRQRRVKKIGALTVTTAVGAPMPQRAL